MFVPFPRFELQKCLYVFLSSVRPQLLVHLLRLDNSNEVVEPRLAHNLCSSSPQRLLLRVRPLRAEDRPQPHLNAGLACLWASSFPPRARPAEQTHGEDRGPRSHHALAQPPGHCCEEPLPLLRQPEARGRVCSQPRVLFFFLLLSRLRPRHLLLPPVQLYGSARPAALQQQHHARHQHGQRLRHRLGGENPLRSDQPELLNWGFKFLWSIIFTALALLTGASYQWEIGMYFIHFHCNHYFHPILLNVVKGAFDAI